MIYFDNAATSYPKPPAVHRAVRQSLTRYGANPGRGGYPMSIATAEMVYGVRCALSELFCAPGPEQVVFCAGATHALNLAMQGYVQPGSHVLISDMEHNAVLRPLEALKQRKGVSFSVFSTKEDPEGQLCLALEAEKTDVLVCSLASNVSGRCLDPTMFARIKARFPALKIIIDGAQAAGHMQISLQDGGMDVLCLPGHKGLLGIMGVGVAIFQDGTDAQTLLQGGSGSLSEEVDMPTLLPERHEAGTLPVPAICALGAGVEFLQSRGLSELCEGLRTLSLTLYDRLSALPDVQVPGPSPVGVLSFLHKKIPPSAMAEALAKRGIYVRAGLHCAPLAHRHLGTLPTGTVRISLSVFNTEAQIHRFYKILRELLSLGV